MAAAAKTWPRFHLIQFCVCHVEDCGRFRFSCSLHWRESEFSCDEDAWL